MIPQFWIPPLEESFRTCHMSHVSSRSWHNCRKKTTKLFMTLLAAGYTYEITWPIHFLESWWRNMMIFSWKGSLAYSKFCLQFPKNETSAGFESLESWVAKWIWQVIMGFLETTSSSAKPIRPITIQLRKTKSKV